VNFDFIAPFYRRLETLVFGNRLESARCAFVRQVDGARRALVVGDGDGRFLAELLRVQPDLEVDYLDASARMLALARARVGSARVHFLHANLLTAALPEAHYDLLATHFFLDCFAEAALREVVEKLSATATEEATWLIADFQETTRWSGRLLLAAMHLFFRVVAGIEARRLVDYQPLLEAKGFRLTSETVLPNDLVRSQLWQRVGRSRPGKS
jgi:ubiquinone/menaquinone biosynthesis C-methylase UbiE